MPETIAERWVAVTRPIGADPSPAWHALEAGLRHQVVDPMLAARAFRHPAVGEHRVDEAIEQFILNDVLIHTWDLATSIGIEVELDAASVTRCLGGLEAAGEQLVASGHYAAATPVPADAVAQSRLLAASGRRPLG